MFLPLVDSLRCIRAHEDNWLVASIDTILDRDVREGVLGCPVCDAEYRIHDGVVTFSEGIVRSTLSEPTEDDAIRLAAALDLTDARMVAVLHGAWGAHAPLVRGISPAQLLLVNPPAGITSGDGVSIVLSEVAPLARASVNAIAMDASASDAMAASLATSLVGGGRLMAPAALPVPAAFSELARDGEIWVARRDPNSISSAPISITRRPSR